MESLLQDVRYGARMLLKKPGFSFLAILTLALGIGANTAIFSVVNSVLLQPLSYKEPDKIVLVSETQRGRQVGVSYANLRDWQEQNQVFAALSPFTAQTVNLTGDGEPERVRGGFVSADFFKIVAVEPALGRAISPGEDRPGGERVTVINHALWQRRFGGAQDLIGKALTLNGEPFTVVGIMPEGFQFPIDEIDLWIPIPYYPNFSNERGTRSMSSMARVKSEVTLEQARADMQTIAGRLEQQYPEANRELGILIRPLHELLVEDIRPSLLILLGAVGLVLLIACANVANLLLVRGLGRQKEIALRSALGAARTRLVRQLLTETLLFGLIGGAIGLLIGSWGKDLLLSLNPGGLPTNIKVTLDGAVLGFTIALTMLTSLVFGLMPALQLSKPDLNEALKEGGRSGGEAAGRQRVRSILVVSQVALAMVLLIGAGLTIKSLLRLQKVDPGFRPENLLTMEYRVPRNKYPKESQQWEFHRQVVERVRQIPEVQSAEVVLGLPFSGNGGSGAFFPLDRPEPAQGEEPRALFNRAGLTYFQTIGIPLLRGRVFSDQDRADSPPVVVINQAMAERFWPDEDPLGKQIRIPEGNVTATIIGVVGNVKQYALEDPLGSQIYAAYPQRPHIFATLVVRTATEPLSLTKAVRDAVWSVDKDQPVWKIRTMDYLLQNSVAQRRFLMLLLGAFAALALLLAAVGIYGVLSYSVTQRIQEIGVRMALGASKRDIFKLVVGHGLLLTVIGLGVGVVAAIAVTRFLAGLLYGVSATDPVIFVVIALLLGAVALTACYIPARRATKVDPMVALRYE